MVRCALCNDQVKRDEDDERLAFDFTPSQLQRSAFDNGCESCLVILEGLRQSEGKDWRWYRDIRRVYARCLCKQGGFQDTLRLEIYFVDDRPKLELEYYSLQPHRKLESRYFASILVTKLTVHKNGKVFYRVRQSVVIRCLSGLFSGSIRH